MTCTANGIRSGVANAEPIAALFPENSECTRVKGSRDDAQPILRPAIVVALWAEHRREPFTLVHSLFSGKSAAIGWAFAASLRIPFAVHVTGGELKQLHEIDTAADSVGQAAGASR